jgi:hypothetical protein
MTHGQAIRRFALMIYAIATIIALADKGLEQGPSLGQIETARAAITDFLPAHLEEGSTLIVVGLPQWKQFYGRTALVRSGVFTDISVKTKLPSEVIHCRTYQICDASSRPLYMLFEVSRPRGGVVLVLSPVLGTGNYDDNPLILLGTTTLFGPVNDTPDCSNMVLAEEPLSITQNIGPSSWIAYSCQGPPTQISTFLEWVQSGCDGLEGWYVCGEAAG